MNLKIVWTNPWLLMIVFLSVLFISGIIKFGSQVIPHVLIAVASAAILDHALDRILRKRIRFPVTGTITGLIIGLVASFTLVWWQTALIAIIAILSKHIIRSKSGHIFNPANFGLLIASFFLPPFIAWWGMAVPILMILFLLTIWKVKRFEVIIPFVILYGLLSGFRIGFDSLIPYLTALLFWMMIMLVEPITSPFNKKGKIAFGILAALAVFVADILDGSRAPLLGLAIANLFVPLIKRYIR